ncbi:hypothetical protein P4678_07430 [Priestia megaterium]|uniref:hypothetical protein n=1 Tax=Priestia megaterium TaxID=1404 RepID=UPI002E24018E|nr:hypothetical protein [Priestia megaterium]MED4290655.1 hypothetical protein [Priestia megaterium]MED4294472.1 hypothetical protein [Priestia megaterium]
MLGVLGLLIVCTLVIWFEVPKLRQKKAKKELWLFYTVLAIGMVVSICKALGLNVPNPSDLSTAIFKPVSIFLLHLLS